MSVQSERKGEREDKKKVIHYTVDDEPQKTTEDELTATQIVKNAGLDPSQRYLLQVVPGKDPISYRDKMDTEIELREAMKFITASTGPTPQS